MSAIPDDILRDMERAVEMRANGRTWVTIGYQLGRTGEEVERWPHQFPDLWDDLFTAPHQYLAADLASQCLGHAKALLHCKEDKIRIQAVVAGLHYHIALRRLNQSKRTNPTSRSIAQEEEYSNEELRIFAKAVLRDLDKESGQSPAAIADHISS